ncbi:F-box domain-containing protein [Mycena sanguinolenta]|uniref:F-box domain-containing protein n=1 Tax=Mycena sanguinolenta TaxID=230812 RepID=A0A8H7DLG6_9AGAR|nr:F-box domain-containing protein [Mycena sanguinolenta]
MLTSMEADRVRLLDLEDRILDLERSLSELRAEQAQVQERLDAYKYPVLTLPNEITSEIFTHFLPVYPAAPPLTGLASPTTLTYVCHKWREVALAIPALWRTIQLHHRNTPPGYEQLHHVSNAWIKRSESCLLSIDIHTTDFNVSPDLFTETLVAAATRLEHLKLWIPLHYHPHNQSHAPAPLPHSSVPTCWHGLHLRCAAAPHSLSPWRCCPKHRFAMGTVDLFDLELRRDKPLRFGFQDELLDSPSPDLTLPCLESLTLNTTLVRMDGFLAAFVVPALSKLDLEEIFLGVESIDTLETFISKSGCRLQEVCIRGKNTEHGDLYTKAFPSISISYLYFRDPWSESEEDDSDSETHSDFTESASE